MVLIGKTGFAFFTVCAAVYWGVFLSLFFPYRENFISMGALALKYHNVVTVKPSITAARPTECEYSCHIEWQIWPFMQFHITGCGSIGVNASPFDKKLSVSPSVPQWVMDVFFFSITRTLLTIEHISSQCIKLILVGSLLSATRHSLAMIFSHCHSYHT